MSSSEGPRYELVIRSLPSDFSHDALNSLFEGLGKIIRAEVRHFPSHTVAHVQFDDQSAALEAIHEVHGSLVSGKKVSVSWSTAYINPFGTSYDVRVEQHPWKLDKQKITELLARYGPTVYANTLP
ncbi:hypothetical protein AAVH_40833 [Aphelenchoides avenae]|nr:hypothetical protein AAVH_40833 [Aphelenchus avenae]